MTSNQPISILLCALGGEGGGVLSEWLIDVARHAGYAAQATSIPGVAQRTGATTYYLEVFPVPLAELAGRRPVFGLNPLPGKLDVLVSSELLETARQIASGLPSNDRTLVITSSARALTTLEKMEMGDGRRDAAQLQKLVQDNSRSHHVVDMAALTREAGTVVSATMLGCIAGSGALPFARADFETVIAAGGATAQASLRGFAKGFDAVAGQRAQLALVEAATGFGATTPAMPSLQNQELSTIVPHGKAASFAMQGDITMAELKPLLEKAFGSWASPAAPKPVKALDRPVPQPRSRVVVIDHLGAASDWAYVVERVRELARERGQWVALFSGDASEDLQLLLRSTAAHEDCRQLWRCLREGGRDMPLSVNISGRLIANEQFADRALRQIRRSGARLCFEITETAVILIR